MGGQREKAHLEADRDARPAALEDDLVAVAQLLRAEVQRVLERDAVLLRVLGDEEERRLEEHLLDVALAVARRVRLVHRLRDERARAVEREAQHIAELGELLAVSEERLVLRVCELLCRDVGGRGWLTLGGDWASSRIMLFMSLGDGEGMQLPGLDGDGRRGEWGYEGDSDSSEPMGDAWGSEPADMANGLMWAFESGE